MQYKQAAVYLYPCPLNKTDNSLFFRGHKIKAFEIATGFGHRREYEEAVKLSLTAREIMPKILFWPLPDLPDENLEMISKTNISLGYIVDSDHRWGLINHNRDKNYEFEMAYAYMACGYLPPWNLVQNLHMKPYDPLGKEEAREVLKASGEVSEIVKENAEYIIKCYS